MDGLHPERSILFFDIDNTLIKMKTDICSDEWIKWQVQLLREHGGSHQHAAAEDERELFQMYQKWMLHNECETDVVEGSAPEIIHRCADIGFKIILVTARHKNIASVTRKQLSKHYNLDKLHDVAIECMENGIFFANGKNKALCIKEIIARAGPDSLDAFLFIDDSISECHNIKNEFDTHEKRIIVCHYAYPQKFHREFHALDKDELHRKWHGSIRLLKN